MTTKRFTHFKASQRFRVIVGDACFYATARQIRAGVGDLTKCNTAVQQALAALENYRSGDDIGQCSTGLGGNWQDLSVQINLA